MEAEREPLFEARDPRGRRVRLYRDTYEDHRDRWKRRGINPPVIEAAITGASHWRMDESAGQPIDEHREQLFAPGLGPRAYVVVVVAYREEGGNVVTAITIGDRLPPDAQRF